MLLIIAFSLHAGYYDSGYIEWSQPNGVTFIGRLVWDEFCATFETIDGYQVKMGDDYYYYYAILDANGDFTISNSRVCIDPPLKESYKLKRSQKCQADIDAKKESSNEEARQLITEMIGSISPFSLNSDKPIAKSTSSMSSNPINMGIVLVEFSDIKRYGYDPDDFNKMMFSSNHEWYDTSINNITHPEGDRIYGSFREYWNEQTNGAITFASTSGIIYPSGSSDPWHELSNTKSYYNSRSTAITTISDELNLSSAPYDAYDKIVIIYAGDTFYGAGLTPHARYLNDRYYILGERHVRLYSGLKFTHIGGHCHEFGHCIGLPHLADGDDENDREDWYYALMEVGDMCGPLQNGECPSGINPLYKIANSWTSSEGIHYISNDALNKTISYNYTNPEYYIVNRSGTYSGSFFILENRLRENFDYYTPNNPSYEGETGDPSGNEGGLLIWRIEPSWIHLVPADNEKSDNYQDLDWENLSYSQDAFPICQTQNFNGNTVPDSKNRYGYDLHYAVQNITWNDVNKTTTMDIYTNAWAGTISSNTTWNNDVYVYGDLTVNSGVVLTINADVIVKEGVTFYVSPGAQLKFASGKKLTINGTLIAQGTSSNHITFTSSNATPSVGDWYGIRFENSSNDANCVIRFCDIQYAQYGIYCNSASPTIKNNNITYNNYGLYLYYSSPSVETNSITNNSPVGIYGTHSSPYLYDNKISNNGTYGVKFYSLSVPYFYYNSFKQNGAIGSYFEGYCYPHFGDYSNSDKGYNVFNNQIYATYFYWYTDPFLGATTQYNESLGGYSTLNCYGYNIYASYNCVVYAHWNYWGASGPIKIFNSQSYVYPYPYLGFDPGGGSSLGKSSLLSQYNQSDDFVKGTYDPMKPNPNRLSDLWLWAHDLCITKQPKEAINIYQILISKFSSTEQAKHALVKIYHLYQDIGKSGLENYLNTLINSQDIDENLKPTAYSLLAGTYFQNKDLNNAKQTCETIITKYPNTEHEKSALYDLVFTSLNDFNDNTVAKSYLGQMKQKYPDDEMTFYACEALGEQVNWSLAKRSYELPKEVTVVLPEKFALRGNYPNPFNPSTTIAFDLPEDSKVSLIIYDIAGREIVKLIDDRLPAGFRNVVWDGKDKTGQTVASGLYIYAMRTSSGFQASKKMVFVR